MGSIVVDFSFLRDQGLITPVEPPVSDKGRRLGKKHYVVEYKMIIQVVDRDLTCALPNLFPTMTYLQIASNPGR